MSSPAGASSSTASSATSPSSRAALKPGAKVVTDGAAELFGAEFGGFK